MTDSPDKDARRADAAMRLNPRQREPWAPNPRRAPRSDGKPISTILGDENWGLPAHMFDGARLPECDWTDLDTTRGTPVYLTARGCGESGCGNSRGLLRIEADQVVIDGIRCNGIGLQNGEVFRFGRIQFEAMMTWLAKEIPDNTRPSANRQTA